MVIFQYNLYIFGIHLRTVLYPNSCYNEPCYKAVEVYMQTLKQFVMQEVFPAHVLKGIWAEDFLWGIFNDVYVIFLFSL